jgi:hypothetical protein
MSSSALSDYVVSSAEGLVNIPQRFSLALTEAYAALL